MYCKYCKKKDHTIDTCTIIKCMICNKVGHTHWNCRLINKSLNKPKTNKKYEIRYNKINKLIEQFPYFNEKYEDFSWG